MKIFYPVSDRFIVAGFGPRESFRLPNGSWTLPFHYGVDFPVPEGTPIFAAHDGVVVFNGWDSSPYGGGQMIGIESGDWSTWYLHRVEGTSHRVGQSVRAGDVIGRVGSTGASTGPHLHFELQLKGEPVDPVPYFVDNSSAVVAGEEDDGLKPTVHVRVEGNPEYMRVHPDIGSGLAPGKSKRDGNVTIFRGYEVSTNKSVGTAWARMHAAGSGYETSRTDRSGYIEIQRQATRLSVAMHG